MLIPESNKMNCEVCGLYKSVTTPNINGRGNPKPKIILIGEAPGVNEDKSGVVFIGRSGDFLNQSIDKLLLDECYIMNSVRCCPYKDSITKEGGVRSPTEYEQKYCYDLFIDELSHYLSPGVILMPLGSTALSSFFPDHGGITKEVGHLRNWIYKEQSYKVIPNYHPAYILRFRSKEYEFKSIMDIALKVIGDPSITNLDDIINYEILTPEMAIIELRKVLKLYRSGEIDSMVYDCETTSLSPFDGKIIMFSFTYKSGKSYSVPLVVNNICYHDQFKSNSDVYDIPFTIDLTQRSAILKELGDVVREVPLIGHNIKFDIKFLVMEDIVKLNEIKVKDDTLLLAFLLEGRSGGLSLGLKDLAKRTFNLQEDWDAGVDKYLESFRLIVDRTYDKIPTSMLGKYAAYDANYTMRLYNHFLTSDLLEPEMNEIRAILNSAVTIFADAEIKGINVDSGTRTFLNTSFHEYIDGIKLSIKGSNTIERYIKDAVKIARDKLGPKSKKNGLSFNDFSDMVFSLNSPNILRTILFDKQYFGIKPHKVTGKASKKKITDEEMIAKASTDEDSINAILRYSNLSDEARDFISSYKRWKSLTKLTSTYLDSLDKHLVEGVYKPEFNLTGTITGRLSSGFHTMPSKSDIKRIFWSRWMNDGGVFISADYSQLELRVAASLSMEVIWIDAYIRGVDLHAKTAAAIFHKEESQITKDERKVGKTINFGIVYGMGSKKLSEDIGVSVDEADIMIADFFQSVPSLKKWIDEQHKFVAEYQSVVTPFNRILRIPIANIHDKWEMFEAFRKSSNYPVQSTASDLVLGSYVRLYKNMKALEMKSILCGSVHDSILVDVYPGELPLVVTLIKKNCEMIPMELYKQRWLTCPIEIGISIGSNWGNAIEFKVDEFSPSSIKIVGEGLRTDFRQLMGVGDCYRWEETDVTEKKLVDVNDKKIFPDDKFIKDSEKWRCSLEVLVK